MTTCITNERIKEQKCRIHSTAFKILFLSLIIDVFFRALISKENFNNLFDLTIIMLVLSIYILIEYSRSGILQMKKNNEIKRKILNAFLLISLFIIAIYLFNPDYSFIRVLISALIDFVIYSLIIALINKVSISKN